jgi:hypothetical protein
MMKFTFIGEVLLTASLSEIFFAKLHYLRQSLCAISLYWRKFHNLFTKNKF